MEGQDIRGLMEAYSQVHETPEVLNEEVEDLQEIGVNFGGQAAVDKVRAQAAAERKSASRIDALRQQRFGSGGSPSAKGSAAITANPPAKPKPTFQNSGGFGRYGAPSTQVKTPTEKPAAAKPAPAKPTSGGTPTAPAKPSPTAGQKPSAPAKPAGSAMDQWRAANPKLAAAADEKARIRGTSQTDNPLMKDMRSKMSMTPSVQSPTLAKDLGKGSGNQSLLDNPNASKAATPKPAPTAAAKPTGFDLAKKGVNLAQSFDVFDVVLGHLLDEGYAETEQNALVMMANMSEEWRDSIIMELTGGKGHPGYKAGSKDHGPLEDGHPADTNKRRAVGGTMSMRHGYHLDDMDDEDEDEDDLESIVKQQSRDSRERVRKPLRDKVKAARKKLMAKEEVEQIDEISKELATKAFATRARDAFELDDIKQSDKADKTKERIVKKHGKKAGDEAEKAAEKAIYGHNKYSEAQEREAAKKKSMKNESIEKWIAKVMLDEEETLTEKLAKGTKGVSFSTGRHQGGFEQAMTEKNPRTGRQRKTSPEMKAIGAHSKAKSAQWKAEHEGDHEAAAKHKKRRDKIAHTVYNKTRRIIDRADND